MKYVLAQREMEKRRSPLAEVRHGQAKTDLSGSEVFALWKDADPDIPILKQAKAEYARLQ